MGIQSRNYLVNLDDLDDLKLIDCGGYKPDGRLVSDLASEIPSLGIRVLFGLCSRIARSVKMAYL